MDILTSWNDLEAAHVRRARRYTTPYLHRRSQGIKHPVFDFLFEYYPTRAAHLERWHPGWGRGLDDAGTSPQAQWRYYSTVNGISSVDIDSYLSKRKQTLQFIHRLLSTTVSNPAHFDCFGLHEWAMVYRTDQPRHDLPLRLGSSETNKVVENHSIRCTHFDAYRFFTPPARPLNLTVLDRHSQVEWEQVGCLHATMDLYKWAMKLGPLVPGELFLDTFELAWDARILDMEASPYDCRAYGLGVVPIEETAGKQEYVGRQRELAERGKVLREQLINLIACVL
ncbi:hypothetical protein N7326_00230 [Corynebacterium sp. ES2794-CONJ1]|uniref:hypothetical protein n=1 Tax=unclassified Corynebacterium TaxID=2624378 RepID=UPI002169E240|nr:MULTISPECIES: hypothetical protein [unclassified Corynebacterium]MCS4491187.1 hypothetical protein [Corynebacterium sp. ES2715-CONJ3]MCS4530932.1 hypothetical protein [Corynebacterium sp. ES2730-CONJ]MCU9518299.1 hypothetical protein [Corynebacterium sp. ES2794-CONJ1]